MRVVLCAMAKNEHKYINEFVNHYYRLGFDKIYIYDNDDIDKPFIGDFIDKKGFVEIINVRGMRKEKLQHELYDKFYKEHEFEWCFFCDIDEYLVGIDTDIHEWLEQKQFKFVNQIRVKWKLFGDSGLIERDTSKSLIETLTKECEWSLSKDLSCKGELENQGKAFVRGCIDGVELHSPHYAVFYNGQVIPSVYPSGKSCNSKIVLKENYGNETVFLNHYMTKTLSEFIEQKLNRNDAVFNTELTLNYYWRINEKTQEKLDYLKERGIL